MNVPSVSFVVLGAPAPKGSAQAFVVKGRAIVVNDCKATKPWQEHVHWTAREYACKTTAPWEGPIGIDIIFRMPRPGRLGKTRLDVECDKRPDIDKLTRTILDALTGVFWKDDGQVTRLSVVQLYADYGMASGAAITVRRLGVVETEPPPLPTFPWRVEGDAV